MPIRKIVQLSEHGLCSQCADLWCVRFSVSMVYSEGTIIIIIVAFVQFKIKFFFTEYDFAVQKMFIEAQNKSKIVDFGVSDCAASDL